MKTTIQNKATQTLAVSGCVDNPLLNGLSFVAIDDNIVTQLANKGQNFTQTKANKHTQKHAKKQAEFSESIKKDDNQAATLPHHPTTYRVKLSLDGIERDGIHFAESQYLGDYDTSEEARAAAIQGIDSTDNAHGAIIDTITWCAATPYRGMVIFMDKPPFVIGCYERIKQAEGVVKRAYDGLKARGAIDWYIEALDGMDSESAVCDGV